MMAMKNPRKKIEIFKKPCNTEPQHTGGSTAYDFWKVKQPVCDVLMFKCNATEMFSAIDVPRSDRHAKVFWPHVVSIALYH